MKRGFTLVELMVVMAITGIMAAQLVGLLDDYRERTWRRSTPIAWASSAQTAFRLVRRDVQAATTVTPGAALTIDTARWHVQDGRLMRGDELIARDVAQVRWAREGDLLTMTVEFAAQRGSQRARAIHVSRIALRGGAR